MKTHVFLRITALFVTFAVIVSVMSACGEDTDNSPSMIDGSYYYDPDQLPEIEYNELRLPYSKSDSLDPLSAKSSMNRQLTTLLYDSLFSIGETYEPVPLIANSYTADHLSVSVTINSGVYFTDGSQMTTNDVVYSFEKASQSSVYSSRLSNFESATATGLNSVLFMLKQPDPYAAACLDFPIIKTGTSLDDLKKINESLAQDEKDSMKKNVHKTVPTGSGRYKLVYEENEADPSLITSASEVSSPKSTR